jgi:hypothetical protein
VCALLEKNQALPYVVWQVTSNNGHKRDCGASKKKMIKREKERLNMLHQPDGERRQQEKENAYSSPMPKEFQKTQYHPA